jgi:hypothetical protein
MAKMRLRGAEVTLADAERHPEAGYDLHQLRSNVIEAKKLLGVAERREAADRERMAAPPSQQAKANGK